MPLMEFAAFDRRPILVAIAGPNGAGKSTFYHAHLASAGLRFVNADVLAAELAVEPLKICVRQGHKAILSPVSWSVDSHAPSLTETVQVLDIFLDFVASSTLYWLCYTSARRWWRTDMLSLNLQQA